MGLWAHGGVGVALATFEWNAVRSDVTQKFPCRLDGSKFSPLIFRQVEIIASADSDELSVDHLFPSVFWMAFQEDRNHAETDLGRPSIPERDFPSVARVVRAAGEGPAPRNALHHLFRLPHRPGPADQGPSRAISSSFAMPGTSFRRTARETGVRRRPSSLPWPLSASRTSSSAVIPTAGRCRACCNRSRSPPCLPSRPGCRTPNDPPHHP